jgi:hypothetical protein
VTRRIVRKEDILAVGTVTDWAQGPYERKADGEWRFEVSVIDQRMQGTPHGPDEPTVTLYPLGDDREFDDPPVFLVRELVEILVPEPREAPLVVEDDHELCERELAELRRRDELAQAVVEAADRVREAWAEWDRLTDEDLTETEDVGPAAWSRLRRACDDLTVAVAARREATDG